MNNKCENYIELISRLYEGELSPQQEAEVREHISLCPNCAAAARDFAALKEDLSSLRTPPPPDLAAKVISRVRAEKKRRSRLIFSLSSLAAAAAALAIVFFSGGLNGIVFYNTAFSPSSPENMVPAGAMVPEPPPQADLGSDDRFTAPDAAASLAPAPIPSPMPAPGAPADSKDAAAEGFDLIVFSLPVSEVLILPQELAEAPIKSIDKQYDYLIMELSDYVSLVAELTLKFPDLAERVKVITDAPFITPGGEYAAVMVK